MLNETLWPNSHKTTSVANFGAPDADEFVKFVQKVGVPFASSPLLRAPHQPRTTPSTA